MPLLYTAWHTHAHTYIHGHLMLLFNLAVQRPTQACLEHPTSPRPAGLSRKLLKLQVSGILAAMVCFVSATNEYCTTKPGNNSTDEVDGRGADVG